MGKAFVRIDASRRADIRYIAGSSGAGKSSYIKNELLQFPRIVIFDPDDEYGDLPGVVSFQDAPALIAYLKEHKTGPARARLVAEGQKAFESVCAAAFAWTNCALVAEEIADVTR
ncbi:hypothetical protein QO214_33575, partial [Burkholderia vietnamiensis]